MDIEENPLTELVRIHLKTIEKMTEENEAGILEKSKLIWKSLSKQSKKKYERIYELKAEESDA